MDSQFWLDVWKNGSLGFHNSKTNPFLMKFWPQLNLAQGDGVFVPLCGKTLDMVWLAEQGYPVLGVELSRLAAQAFFEENAIEPDVRETGRFTQWQGGGIELYVGDFFDLTADDLKNVRGVFDRAAIVALPKEMRKDYAIRLGELLAAGTQILLFAFEYDQAQKQGPPHSVPSAEIEQIFSPSFTVQKLDQRELIDKAPGMQRAGLTSFEQHVYLLQKR